jgi:hypothetical protein
VGGVAKTPECDSYPLDRFVRQSRGGRRHSEIPEVRRCGKRQSRIRPVGRALGSWGSQAASDRCIPTKASPIRTLAVAATGNGLLAPDRSALSLHTRRHRIYT